MSSEERPSLRHGVREWATTQSPEWTLAPVDQAVRVTYVARTEPDARFGDFLWKDRTERGLGAPVRDLAVVADGSSHLDQVVDTQLRLPDLQVNRIVDVPHAQQQLWTLSKAVFGDGAPAGVRSRAGAPPSAGALPGGAAVCLHQRRLHCA